MLLLCPRLSIPAKRSHCDRMYCKLANFQQAFSMTRDFSLFLQINRLNKTKETLLHQRSKQQEPQPLNQPNPNATVTKLLKRRTTSFESSASQVPHIIQNAIYVTNPQQNISVCFYISGKRQKSIYPTQTRPDYRIVLNTCISTKRRGPAFGINQNWLSLWT